MFEKNKGIKNIIEQNKKELDGNYNELNIDIDSDVDELDYMQLQGDSIGGDCPLYEYIKVIDLSTYDSSRLTQGINSVSELCGKISALCNVGINPHKALDYLMEIQLSNDVLRNNLEIAKINAEANIEISRMDSANTQKNII